MGYDASLAVNTPLTLQPGQSLVTAASVERIGEKTPDTVPDQYARGPLRTAAVLTCVNQPPSADAFRPAYVGTQKLQFTVGQLRRDLLPRLAAVGKLPQLKLYERYLERIWLDHLHEWPNRQMHPLENMPDYGREITNIVSTVSLMLLVDVEPKTHKPASYDAFYGRDAFVEAMWRTYRPKADEIGANTMRKGVKTRATD